MRDMSGKYKCYLKLDGVDGGAKAPGHDGVIDGIKGWGWDATVGGDAVSIVENAKNGNTRTYAPKPSYLTLVRSCGGDAVSLATMLDKTTTISKGELFIYGPSGEEPILTVTMENVRVIELSNTFTRTQGTDTVAFSFGNIVFDYGKRGSDDKNTKNSVVNWKEEFGARPETQ